MPGQDVYREIGDRWDALPAAEQAARWEPADAALLAALDAVPADRRADLEVSFGPHPPWPFVSFTGPMESAVRLIYGRLGPKDTSNGVAATGTLSPARLRATFPGF